MFAATSRANYFYHFEGTTYSTAGSKNSVFGYDRENGQARPVVEAGAELFWTETGNNAWAWNLTKMLEGFSVHLTGDNGATPTTGFQPSTKDVKFSRADNGMRYLFDLYDAGAGVRTKRDWISTDGTGPYQYSSINNQGYSWFKMDNNTSGKGLLKMYKDRAPVINELVAGRTQWEVGDMVYNNVPASGKPTGWVCVTAGNPGTWQAFGVLDGGINSLQTAVRYYRATAFSVPTTATIIPYDTKVFDTLNEFNKAGSLNRFTAASAGVYEVSASMYFSSVAASVRGELWLYKNAAADCRIATFTNSTAAFQQQVSGKCLVQLAANDIIDVRGLMTTATSTVADATGTTIHITRIS